MNGGWAINDTTFVVTAPNAALLPEYSEKYVARLAYYYEPAGELSLTVTQNEVTNLRQDITVSADDFGYGANWVFGLKGTF
jgi:hypothetical protein